MRAYIKKFPKETYWKSILMMDFLDNLDSIRNELQVCCRCPVGLSINGERIKNFLNSEAWPTVKVLIGKVDPPLTNRHLSSHREKSRQTPGCHIRGYSANNISGRPISVSVTENAHPQKLVFSIEKMIGKFNQKFHLRIQIPSNFLGEAIWVRPS